MLNTITIDNPNDPRIADYLGIRDAWLREPGLAPTPLPTSSQTPQTPTFMAEGLVVLEQMARSAVPAISVLVTPARFEAARSVIEQLTQLSDPPPPIYLAEPAVMDAVAGFHIHRGLLAIGKRPTPPSPLQLLERGTRTFVIAENLSNHDNIGQIFRSTAALAGPNSAVLLSPGSADPLYRKSLRVSVGCALSIPHARISPWPEALAELAKAGVQIVALALGPTCQPIKTIVQQLDPNRPVALLVGAEGPGLTPEALKHATHTAQIPIWDAVDSLNVGVATSIALALLNNLEPTR